MQILLQQIESLGEPWTPLVLCAVFIASSLLIVWRLEAMTHRGVEGTVLGTLFMPYFSGLGNLIFVGVILKQGGPPVEVAVNSLVNNVTNLCLLIAVPALIWGLNLNAGSKRKKAVQASKLHRLSLGLTLLAMLFFSLMVWVLAQDGQIDRYDGFALVGLFLFWQSFHVYEVLKENARGNSSWHPAILFDCALIFVGSYFTLISVDGFVAWIMKHESGFLGPSYLGLLTGWLMVLPNAVLALYYGWRNRGDVVYASQAGDGHICIPLCLGLFAIFKPIPLPDELANGLLLIGGVALVHLFCVVFLRSLPKWIALQLVGLYGYVLFRHLVG